MAPESAQTTPPEAVFAVRVTVPFVLTEVAAEVMDTVGGSVLPHPVAKESARPSATMAHAVMKSLTTRRVNPYLFMIPKSPVIEPIAWAFFTWQSTVACLSAAVLRYNVRDFYGYCKDLNRLE